MSEERLKALKSRLENLETKLISEDDASSRTVLMHDYKKVLEQLLITEILQLRPSELANKLADVLKSFSFSSPEIEVKDGRIVEGGNQISAMFIGDPRRIDYWTSAPPPPPSIEELKESGKWDDIPEDQKRLMLEARRIALRDAEKRKAIIAKILQSTKED